MKSVCVCVCLKQACAIDTHVYVSVYEFKSQQRTESVSFLYMCNYI